MRVLTLLFVSLLFSADTFAQWVVTPSTPVSSYSQPNWKTDVDLNDSYTAITYGNQNPSTSPGGTGTWLKIYNSSNTAITGDIQVFNMGFMVSRVKISDSNIIYVLGTNDYSSVTKLVLKRYTATGTYLSSTIVNHSIGGAVYDLEVTDQGDVLVSLFEGDNLRIRSYSASLAYKGIINVANSVTHFHLPTSNLRYQSIDYNAGKILIGYSRGVDASLTSYIKKYTYNSSTPGASALTNTYSFTGGFTRRNLESYNSHQVALRANGDVFYVNGLSGVKRITGSTTTSIYGNTKTKVNVDANDNMLITYTDNTKAYGRLYNSSNSFVHYYTEDGNINGSWGSAFDNCKFVIVGDKSYQGTNYHTNRKPHYQVFNCSDCEAGGPATAAFDFRFPNQIIQMNSLYGPQDVAELCLVDNLWVDGSASCNETGYFVELSEFNLMSWTDVNILYSAWVCTGCQAPNNIDITNFLPLGYQLRPNKIYKFKLAVGSPWHSVTKFFKISCCTRDIIELPDDKKEIEQDFGKAPEHDHETQNDQPAHAINIFPNPTDSRISIDISEASTVGKYSVEIMDIRGEKIYQSDFEGDHFDLDMSEWEKGIYICTITLNGESITRQIVKE